MAKAQTKANPARKIEAKDVSQLQLDPQNPRLALESSASADAILKRMYAAEALEELAHSLVRNGYFWEEPLVIVPEKGKLIVVEGNRRLATLKLLLDPALRKKIGVTPDFPELTAARAAELKKFGVPTVTYESRDLVVPFLGFRHITGVKKWEPLAKAKYVTSLIDAGTPISDIEESIGDDARTVKRLYQTFIVYKQIEDDLTMETKEIRDNFSLLEVSLSQVSIKEFLGVGKKLPETKTDTVVPTTNLEKLRELIGWVYGDGPLLRVITDSRQISKRLAPVVASTDALTYLRKTRDLEAAYDRSGGERDYYVKQIAAASRSVERANGIAPLFTKDKEIISQIERLEKLVQALGRVARA